MELSPAMPRSWPTSLRRCWSAALSALAALALVACGDLASALPARPSPFPTLARLPSVTPVTPGPTRLPSPTSAPTRTSTIVSRPSRALVAVAANLRSGPGLDYAVVTVLDAGTSLTLGEHQGEWYAVQTADGAQGWMSDQVLDLLAETR